MNPLIIGVSSGVGVILVVAGVFIWTMLQKTHHQVTEAFHQGSQEARPPDF